MKAIKKITVFYTDGTFEDIEKTQPVEQSKYFPSVVPANPTIVPNTINPSWWGGIPTSTTTSLKPETTTYQYSPQPIGSAQLTTVGIQALTSAQIASFSISSSTYSDKSQW